MKRDLGFFVNIAFLLRTLSIISILFFVLRGSAQWGVGIDAEPFLYYSGNFLGNTTASPNWVGSEGLVDGLDFYRYRESQDDWMRYRLSIHMYRREEKESVTLLDDNLNQIGDLSAFDRSTWKGLNLTFGIEREKWIGKKQLKGLFARGVSVTVQNENFEVVVQNPLGAYVSDTLWFDSGFLFASSLFVQTGVVYSINESLSISGRLGYGISFNYQSNSRQRKVDFVGSSAELIQYEGDEGNTLWSIDTFVRPQFTLTFYFDSW